MIRRRSKRFRFPYALAAVIAGLVLLFLTLPSILVVDQRNTNTQPAFPVSVDPVNKVIKDSPSADASFFVPPPAQSSRIQTKTLFAAVARTLSNTSFYQLAAAQGAVPSIVTIYPGLRKEQVAALFGNKLGWDTDEQKQFTKLPPVSTTQLEDGMIVPGNYAVYKGDSLVVVQQDVRERFENEVLSRYTPAVQKVVPLEEGLIIASIIERETSDPEEMRLISGVIWNRLFAGMKLQMDSTVQYSKATGRGPWWPPLSPRDKFINSPYNTYQHEGLPPHPIASPSTAAIFATLNPVKTSCFYYFHDDEGDIHCSDTYEEHVAVLKQHYGQGR